MVEDGDLPFVFFVFGMVIVLNFEKTSNKDDGYY